MPKGYVIFTEAIHDEAAMNDYVGPAMASMMQHGGRVLVVDDNPDAIEGEWYGNRTVVLEFDSVEAARSWYQSPEYQKALPIRLAAAAGNAAIVSGFEMPGG